MPNYKFAIDIVRIEKKINKHVYLYNHFYANLDEAMIICRWRGEDRKSYLRIDRLCHVCDSNHIDNELTFTLCYLQSIILY